MRPAMVLFLCGFVSMACSSSGSPDECSTDQDCPAGTFCRNGDCEFDCTNHDDCPDGFRCSARGRCERGCVESNDGEEACDGVDNDCDEETDEDFEVLGQPCSNQGCEEGSWICSPDGIGVICDGRHPSDADLLCDGFDEDCDGETDEDAAPRDCPQQLGICAGVQQVCLPDTFWSECDYGPDYTEGLDDICDLVDNDCDGETDEDAVMTLVPETGDQADDGIDNNCNGLIDEAGGVMVPLVNYPNVWIDAYEVSIYDNPDCTGTHYGTASDDYPPEWPAEGPASVIIYGCSLPDVVPSGYLSWNRAKRACESQGKRLCAKYEWGDGCTGGTSNFYPYGPDFVAGICNDAWAGAGQVVETASQEGCVSPSWVYDASGNLCEWLQDLDADQPGNALCGGFHYLCHIVIYENSVDMPCNPDLDWHEDHIQGASDCYISNYDNSFPMAPAEPYLGARCCLQK